MKFARFLVCKSLQKFAILDLGVCKNYLEYLILNYNE